MNRINRKYIDRLKVKGAKWLEDNIAMEKRLSTAEEPTYVLYIEAMEKALKELNESENIWPVHNLNLESILSWRY